MNAKEKFRQILFDRARWKNAIKEARLVLCVGILVLAIMAWNASHNIKPSNSFLNINIFPSDVDIPYNTTRTFLALIHNGTSPYNVAWYSNETYLGNGTSLDFGCTKEFGFSKPFSYASLKVIVTDANNAIGMDTTIVYDSFQGAYENLAIYLGAPGPYSYIVDTNSTHYFKFNGTTGEMEYSSTSYGNAINFALGNLTSGRTWKEKVVQKGNFTIDKQILIRNYTILDSTQAYFTLSASLNLGSNGETGNGGVHGIIYNTDVPATDIDIIGGTIGENANSHNSIRLENVTKANIYGVTCYDHIHLDNVSDSFIQYCTLKPLANIVLHKAECNNTIQYNNIENGQIYAHWYQYKDTWGVPADNNKIRYNRVFTSTRNDTSMMLYDYCYNTMIQGNQIFVNGAGIYLYGAHNSSIIDNYIKDLYMNSTQHGVDSAWTNYQDRSGNTIIGFAKGFTFDSSGSATVARNRFLDCDIGIGGYNPPSTRRFEITGNLFFNNGIALELKGYMHNVVGNTFQNCTTGIWIGEVGRGNLIDDNTFTNCGSPIYMRNQCVDNQITNNEFFNNTGIAIQFWEGGSNNTIRGNTIKYNLGDGIDFHGAAATDENIIEDNVIECNGDASGEYGIDLNAYCDNNIIKNNYLRGNYAGQIRIANANCDNNIIRYNNITGTITNSGTNTKIRYNDGYVTECSGSAMNATAITFTITHGLVATPVQVFCSFNATGFSWKWTATSSTITITLSASTGDDAITCYYEARTWNYP